MEIVDLVVETFRYHSQVVRDSEGHTHPGPEHEARQTLLRVVSDEGIEGYAFGTRAEVIQHIVKPVLVGADPFYRDRVTSQNDAGGPRRTGENQLFPKPASA